MTGLNFFFGDDPSQRKSIRLSRKSVGETLRKKSAQVPVCSGLYKR